jgi:cold shock CspA family protein
MRHIRVDYQPPARQAEQRTQRQGQQRPPVQTPRCADHPGVRMVLAGSNQRWNTVRYLCPMCNAMGRPPVEIATGVVSAYFPDRGYGFIDNGGPRIFFHISDWRDAATPYVGMPVTCQVAENDRGLIGRQVGPR